MDAQLTCVAGVAGAEEAVTPSMAERRERPVFASENAAIKPYPNGPRPARPVISQKSLCPGT